MKNDFRGYAIYSQFGFVIISTILIGIALGKKFDLIFNTEPIFLIIFLILSIISSFINFYFKVIKTFENKKPIKQNNYIHIINFIVETIFSFVLCIFLGDFFDKKYNKNNIFIVMFCIICLVFNILIFIKKFDVKSILIFRRKKNENI